MQLLKGITHLHKYLLALCNSTKIMYAATAINHLKLKTEVSSSRHLAKEKQLAAAAGEGIPACTRQCAAAPAGAGGGHQPNQPWLW